MGSALQTGGNHEHQNANQGTQSYTGVVILVSYHFISGVLCAPENSDVQVLF